MLPNICIPFVAFLLVSAAISILFTVGNHTCEICFKSNYTIFPPNPVGNYTTILWIFSGDLEKWTL